jgi:hypothetical protein
MRRLAGLVLTAAIALGAVSTAAAAGSAEPVVKKERKVCRIYAKTQSRIGSNRVCKTQSQWDADGLRDAISMEKFKTENTGRPIITGPGAPPARRN